MTDRRLEFRSEVMAKVDRLVRSLQRHKERYIRAWIAATGVHPRDAMILEQRDGLETRIMVVHKSEYPACKHCGRTFL